MRLPSFKKKSSSSEKVDFAPAAFTKAQAHHLTRTRKALAVTCSVLFFIALFFLILVQIGNTRDRNVLTDWYLFKIDISDIAITSYHGDVTFSNSLAQTVGLHDFYQVGLWSWCEGYDNGEGVVSCSDPQFGYWFNPVEIILGELFAGATITLPSDIYTYLTIIRLASHAMFGTFFAGTLCAFICIFLSLLTLYSRLLTAFIGPLIILTSLVIIAAAIISTAMWSIFTSVINSNAAGLGIEPIIGREMLAFMWIAAACALIAAIFQLCMMCCCTSRRDVKLGKKGARKAAMKEREHERDARNSSSSTNVNGQV